MSLIEDNYSLHRGLVESKHNLNQADSQIDQPIENMSGDEAGNYSFMSSSMYIKAWAVDQKSTIFLTSITIMKSIIGVGILGLPNIARNFGLVITVLLLLLFHLLTEFNTQLLIKCKNLTGHSNFSTIGYEIFKSKYILLFINCCLIFNNFGLTLSELIVFGTTSSNLLTLIYPDLTKEQFPWYAQKWFVQLSIGILLFPLALLKKIEKLRFVSLIAIFSITSFCVVIIYNFSTTMINTGPAQGFEWFPSNFNFKSAFGCLPTILLAYNWQFNFFPVFKGMKFPRDKNITRATLFGMSTATLFYIIVGALGYASFGDIVVSDFLSIVTQAQVGKPFFIILNSAFCLSTALSMPIMFFGARNNFIELTRPKKREWRPKASQTQIREQLSPTQLQQKNEEQLKYDKRFSLCTFFLWALMITLAITIDSLEVAFSLIGAISSNAIGCILPTLFYFRITDKLRDKNIFSRFKLYHLYFVKTIFVISILFTFVCVSSEIIKIIQD